MIQITPQMRILVAVEAVAGRKGIDSLAQLCQEKLQTDPFSGCLFVFRSRRGTAIRILVYDGQGFWLAQKRLSKGRFRWWPEGRSPHEVARSLAAHQLEASSSSQERTGLFTSGIVSTTRQGRRIALFFTGRNHAGENLARVFVERAKGLAPPIQMSDALSRNVPKLKEKLEILWGNCNAHARRRFVEVTPNFPEECRFVLESFRDVYGYEAEAQRRGLVPEARLRFHQERSQPVRDALHAWFEAQFNEKKVEPNSGLGEAITYCLKRWTRLTLFLRQAGAPLDSNLVERALKKCILHRKNSLFYKTENGAEMGDLHMSLIHTCELNGVNPFEYLIELQKHAEELTQHPADGMPWNYRQALPPAGTSQPPA